MATTEEVGAEVDAIRTLVVDTEREVVDLESVTQRTRVHEVAVHVIGGDAVLKH